MLLKVAWRNIWRRKVRSGVVLVAIALGLVAGVFASAFVQGMMKQKVDSTVSLEYSHVQVHAPNFREEFDSKLHIPNGPEVEEALRNDDRVAKVASRVIVFGMLNSTRSSGGVKLVGIDPGDEAALTNLDSYIVEGEYLPVDKRNPILISRKLAEKYKLKIRSKVVFNFQDANLDMQAAGFRVAGIFDTNNGIFDEMNVFVKRDHLSKVAGVGDGFHEVAALLHEHDLAESVANDYQSKFKELEVLPWLDLALGMRYMISVLDQYTYYIVGIILLALLFSVINTMLMAVLERTREIGMLMAVGMSKTRVFAMIMLETLMLSFVGGPLGLLASWLLVLYFGATGIDLGGATTYADYGFPSNIYPYLETDVYFNVAFMVMIMAVLAAIYPARSALKLNPSQAIKDLDNEQLRNRDQGPNEGI